MNRYEDQGLRSTPPCSLRKREVRRAELAVITRARRWARQGGLGWSDDRWEVELADLRAALKRLEEARHG